VKLTFQILQHTINIVVEIIVQKNLI